MKNFLIQASTVVSGEDLNDAILKFAERIKENPTKDNKNIHWNTVPLANAIEKEDPVKDIKHGKEYGPQESSAEATTEQYGSQI